MTSVAPVVMMCDATVQVDNMATLIIPNVAFACGVRASTSQMKRLRAYVTSCSFAF